MIIPFTKAHGAKNDFLLTWSTDAPADGLENVAVGICDRHCGVGADGWIIVTQPLEDAPPSIRLFNSDGSEAELSGNGTRCAAAFLIEAELASDVVRILTGAGLKELRTIGREDNKFLFEMNMGTAVVRDEDVCFRLPLRSGQQEVTILNVGNPQCVVFVEDFTFDWRSIGREIEVHSHFPKKTNVSFVRVVNDHTIEVRFFERGAGETMSSGTGSTGAAAAAMIRGLVKSPVAVVTPAGALDLRRDGTTFFLTGPAEITAKGEFYL